MQRCPQCQTELAATAARCPACGAVCAASPAEVCLDSLPSAPPTGSSLSPPLHPSSAGGDATFISDEWPELLAPAPDPTLQFETPEEEAGQDTAGTVELPPRAPAAVEDSHAATCDLGEAGGSASASEVDKTYATEDGESVESSATMISHDNEEEGTVATVMSDDVSGSDPSDPSSQTLMSDDQLGVHDLRTLASNWPGAAAAADSPRMTIRSQADGSLEAKGSPSISLEAIPQRNLRVVGAPIFGGTPEYELIKILGEGGMGVVWSARQVSVDRHVAVKMIKGPQAGKQSQRRKFLAEAVVTGDLDHPNIVPIYDVGVDSTGALFYSMKQVQGTPWLKVIKERPLKENLETLLRVADAVSFAHARGIVHRDLKPENVMLGDFGEVLVMDWGLALALGDLDKARQLRQSTSMGGTPAYMAPEMATGPIDRITPASDQYLLGAILWEILTGRPPHPGKKIQECLLAAMRNQINATEKSGELVDIARKAMATAAQDRYPTVRDFQAAIRGYLAHSESVAMAERAEADLIQARQTNDYSDFAKAVFGYEEAYELWPGNQAARLGINNARLEYAGSALTKGDFDLGKSLLRPDVPKHQPLLQQIALAQTEREARQHRLRMAKQAMAAMVASILIIISVAFFWIRSERAVALQERDRATEARQFEAEARVKAEDATREARVATQAALSAKAEEEAQRLTAEAATRDARAAQEQEAAQRRKAEEATAAAIAARQQEEAARLDAERAKAAEEYEAYIARVGLAAAKIKENAFDVATTLLDECPPALRNWEWGRLMHLCRQSATRFKADGPVDSVAISPDGKRLLAAAWDHKARVWDLDSHQVLFELPQSTLYVHAAAWSPDGNLLAVGGDDPQGLIKLYDANTGSFLAQANGHREAVVSAHFAPDSRWLLTTSYDQTGRLWDVQDPRQPREVAVLDAHSWWVWSGAFSPGFDLSNPQADNRLVTVGQDGKAIVWSVTASADGSATPTPQVTFTGHSGPVYAVDFAPRSGVIATGGYDRQVLLWRPEDIPAIDVSQLLSGERPPLKFQQLASHTGPVQSVAFSTDGRMLVSGGRDNAVTAWSLDTNEVLKTFRGHFSGVRSVALSPDGRHVISGGLDHQVIVWSVDEYEEIRVLNGRRLAGHDDAVLSAEFSNDGAMILTSSRDRTARTWNSRTGEVLQTFSEGHQYLASRAVFFPDERTLVTAAADNTVRLWDVATGAQFLSLNQTGRGAVLALSADGKLLATGSEGDEARLYRTMDLLKYAADQDGESDDVAPAFTRVAGHNGRISALAFAPSGPELLTCDVNGRCQLQNATTGAVLWNVRHHQRRVNACAFAPDGSRIYTASNDQTVSCIDSRTGEEIVAGILKHRGPVVALDIDRAGQRALTVETAQNTGDSTQSIIRLWELNPVREVHSVATDTFSAQHIEFIPGQSAALLVGNDNTLRQLTLSEREIVLSPTPWLNFQTLGGLVWGTRFSADGRSVLTIGGSEARLWDFYSRRTKMSFSPHGAVAAADFSPDARRIVTGSWDHSAKIWDVAAAQAIRKLEGVHSGYINSVCYSPDGQRLLTASDDGRAVVWDAETGTMLRTLDGHQGRVRQAVYSPNGERILTVSSDRTARLWDAETGAPLGVPWTGHRWGLLCAAFSPDGQRAITGSEDNDARIWDVATGKPIGACQGHTAAIAAVTFSRDGLRVFTASQDNTAKLWDASPGHEGHEILTLTGHSQELTSIAVSPDGRQALTASRDGTAVIWPTAPWKPEVDQTAARP